ncbi:hypothetical protein M422DRAFT_267173 [Sphaerobolus stellatus SS14]|uniref:Uncharacterized protein n=1 Tax=Sphaerobolus stellatus (strain SS14) TaxID=990650 RepID=A0A0C9V185_SPHS4|nr:hypothetical protein M422DRAFT_267173 [Sphaerobolus stellatus SS14]
MVEILGASQTLSIDLESEEDQSLLPPLASLRRTFGESNQSFIEVIHHPHSGITTATIIPIDVPKSNKSNAHIFSSSSNFHSSFRQRADFEFARTVVTKALNRETVEIFLAGFQGRWASNTHISFVNFSDFQRTLEAARHFGVQDLLPWEVIVPHCFFPIHLWPDKSNVAKTVKKHPIILRPGFLPSVVRNASGNGGGVLIGYMAIVGDPSETADNEDDSASSVEIAQSKREVYHKIHHVIFRSIRCRSRRGEAVICGDKITRVLHPGFLIHAVDGEEAYCLCGTRGVKANYPCPQGCLIHKSFLHNLSKPLVMRTQNNMEELFIKALTLSCNTAEKLLRDAGLHLVKNAFWSIQNSDPYLAYSYDMLHAFDSGEWGKHQWPLLLDHILDASGKRRLTSNMRQVPRWRSLKHFNAVTSIDFLDGNGYWDILKRIIPCLTDILPSNSPVTHCFRLLGILRAIAGLRPVSEEHIVYFEKSLPKYEKLCTAYNKNYTYPKHHFLMHLPWDLRAKASTDNYTTRPGEGFQQEVQQAYDQTNFRDIEPQMVRIDETQEAIARITMAVDQYDSSRYTMMQEEIENDGEEAPTPLIEGDHWKLGSPLQRISAQEWEPSQTGHSAFRRFESRLTAFLNEVLPADDRPQQPILLEPYQCIYLHYRSFENWQEHRDILRCNPNFYDKPRYDCVVINTKPISFARIYGLFSCETPSKTRHDIALIGKFQTSSWKPKTRWDGCRIFEEKHSDFVFIKYLIRGCHMVPTFEKSGKVYYLNDLVDGDAFLRFFLADRLSQTEV